jgi:hypothetical protein
MVQICIAICMRLSCIIDLLDIIRLICRTSYCICAPASFEINNGTQNLHVSPCYPSSFEYFFRVPLLTNLTSSNSTGATGYIGGNTLHALYNKHPEYEYTALVRTEEKGEPVKKAFPNIRLVIGDNDNSKVLEDEASKADVVIRESPSFKPSRGCTRSHTDLEI